jgi:hypothetical protein
MKVFELLQITKETGDIVVNDDWALGIKYHDELKCYVWCDKDGNLIPDNTDKFGYKRVILSPKLLDKNGWRLEPVNYTKAHCKKQSKHTYQDGYVNGFNKGLTTGYRIGINNDSNFICTNDGMFLIDGNTIMQLWPPCEYYY